MKDFSLFPFRHVMEATFFEVFFGEVPDGVEVDSLLAGAESFFSTGLRVIFTVGEEKVNP